MRRRLLNSLSAVSLLLCLCLGALWVFSYFREGDLEWVNSACTTGVLADVTNGHFYASSGTVAPNEKIRFAPGFQMKSFSKELDEYRAIDSGLLNTSGSNGFRRHAFGYAHLPDRGWAPDFHLILVPIWLLMLPTIILPGAWPLRRRRARIRQTVGLCPHCGYDLRATPGRCPECGPTPKIVASAR